MLRPLIYLPPILLFFACSSPGTPVKHVIDSPMVMADTAGLHRPAKPALTGFKALDTLIPFAGVYINQLYLDRIRENRSPHLDQNIDASCIIIPARTLQVTRMVGGFHDGAADMVVVKNENDFAFYDASLSDLMFSIKPFPDGRLQIGDQFFRQLHRADINKADWGILEELLFSGKYHTAQGKEVVFGVDGRISGLDSILYYEPVIDYAARDNGNIDLIRLGSHPQKLEDYGFYFDKDTLLIYIPQCLKYNTGEKMCDSAVFGDIAYKLVKEQL